MLSSDADLIEKFSLIAPQMLISSICWVDSIGAPGKPFNICYFKQILSSLSVVNQIVSKLFGFHWAATRLKLCKYHWGHQLGAGLVTISFYEQQAKQCVTIKVCKWLNIFGCWHVMDVMIIIYTLLSQHQAQVSLHTRSESGDGEEKPGNWYQ